MQTDKTLMMFQKHPENFASQVFLILQYFALKICYFLKKSYFLTVSNVFSVFKQNLMAR